MKLSRILIVSIAAIALVSGCGDSGSPTGPGANLDTTPPPAPTSLAVTMDELTGIGYVDWAASAAADLAGYEVWAAENGTGTFTQVGRLGADATRYLSPPVERTTQMEYRVRAFDLTGNRSAYSSTVSTELRPVLRDGEPGTGRIEP